MGVRDDQQEEPKTRWFDHLGMISLLLLIAFIFFLMSRLPSLISLLWCDTENVTLPTDTRLISAHIEHR